MLHGYNEGIDWWRSKKKNSILNATEWQILSKQIAMTSMKKRGFQKLYIHSRTHKRNAVKKRTSKTQMKCLVTKSTTNPNSATWYLTAPDRGSENGKWSFSSLKRVFFTYKRSEKHARRRSKAYPPTQIPPCLESKWETLPRIFKLSQSWCTIICWFNIQNIHLNNTNTAVSVGQLTLIEMRALVFQDFVDQQFPFFFASQALNVPTKLSFF